MDSVTSLARRTPETEARDDRPGKPNRRGALVMLSGAASAVLGSYFLPSALTTAHRFSRLEKQLVQAIADHDWWMKKVLAIDFTIPDHLEARLHAYPRDTAARVELADLNRACGLEFSESQADAAWERQLAVEQQIGASTATDMRGLMVQAQALACRHWIGMLDELALVMAFIQGIEALLPANDRPSASDAEIFSACCDWNAAIDEVHAAEKASEEINLPSRARGYPKQISDPVRRAAMEAEQERSGWRAAIERVRAAHDRQTTMEEAMTLRTASSFSALLAQARPVARRLAPGRSQHPVTGRIGMALVRGLERLGGQRTRDLHEWWETEADDPPTSIGWRRS